MENSWDGYNPKLEHTHMDDKNSEVAKSHDREVSEISNTYFDIMIDWRAVGLVLGG
jgi:hypothetical protein